MRSALITGITGQDGSFLAELMLEKGYRVYGLAREKSWNQPNCSSHLDGKVEIIFGDITNNQSIIETVKTTQPNEIYNLASQSRPGESWSKAPETLMVNGLAAIQLFEAVRLHSPKCRVYHASSSEMFGKTSIAPQNEQTLYSPVNPYAAAKVYAHQMAQIYRESYGLYIASGILFNHESERRPLSFVTQKIAYGAACAGLGIMTSPDLNEKGRPIVENGKLSLGNLDIARDWGYAPDYVKAMWMILQQDKPEDFAIGTGVLHTLRELCEYAYHTFKLDWHDFVISDPALMRPLEPGIAHADISKASNVLGWKPSLSFQEMVQHMVQSQVKHLQAKINQSQ